MKKKTIVSPYSMMYLVTPAIYEKLLLCIDDGDKKLLDNLNNPPDENQDRRPAQIRLDALSSEEIKPIVSLPFNGPSTAIHNVPIVQQPQQQDQIVPISQSIPIVQQQQQQQQQQQEVVVPTPQVQPQPLHQQQQLPITVSIAPPVDGNNPLSIPVGQNQPQYMANIKPVNITIPSNVTQPATFLQPVVQQIDPSNVPLPEDDMLIDDPSLKRPIDSEDLVDVKRQRQRGNVHYERDIKYKGDMLQRIQERKNRLRKNLVQWQPLQCITNTTGGQICNPDPINQPILTETKQEVSSITQPLVPTYQPKIRVRGDLIARPNACKICGVNMGDQDLLRMHYRLKHKMTDIPVDTNIMSNTKFEMPGLEVKPIIKKDIKLEKKITTGKIKKKRKRFTTPGFEPPISPFIYDSKNDQSFRRFKVKKEKRKRFTSAGDEPQLDPLIYDPSLDVPFRKSKVTKKSGVQRQALPKANQYRCPICEMVMKNITLFKKHMVSEHNEDANDVIRNMASNVLSNPQPGSSRDFTNWTSIRLQQPRAVQRRREFGQIKKTTSNFEKWD